MFSSGADVNLNAVYRSTSAGTTKFVIGETYRQAGTNAVFKFVEVGAGTPTVVQGVPLVSGTLTASSLNGAAGVWDGEATNLGLFQGIAQNTEALTATDIGSGRTVCVWTQVAGNNVSYLATDQAGEVGFDPGGNAASLTVTAVVGQDVGTVNTVSTTDILMLFDGTVTMGTDSNLDVGGAFTPYNGTTGGTAGTVKAVYKDGAGALRGLRFNASSIAVANDRLSSSGGVGTQASNVLLVAAPGYASLRGTY